jgi:hypothetical protein
MRIGRRGFLAGLLALPVVSKVAAAAGPEHWWRNVKAHEAPTMYLNSEVLETYRGLLASETEHVPRGHGTGRLAVIKPTEFSGAWPFQRRETAAEFLAERASRRRMRRFAVWERR